MSAGHYPPTSVDVARRAGVSRTTVSYVLNGTPHQRISQETRERVLSAARELDYHVQPSARALRKGQNDAIYLILDRPLTLFLSSLTSALQKRACELGYTLAVYFNETTTEEERRDFLGQIFSQRPLGIVTLPGGLSPDDIELARSKGAGYCVSTYDRPIYEASPLRAQEGEPGRVIAHHLLERGHRNLGIIAPQNKFLRYAFEPRLACMRSVLAEAGLPELQQFPIAEITLEEARRVARQLRQDPSHPTALYGFNDEYCFHLLRAFREEGLRVPEDIALVGADDTPFCELTTPSLTSVRLDIVGISKYLIDLIARMAKQGKEDDERPFELIQPPVLVPRESS